jgi:hypothetical protein
MPTNDAPSEGADDEGEANQSDRDRRRQHVTQAVQSLREALSVTPVSDAAFQSLQDTYLELRAYQQARAPGLPRANFAGTRWVARNGEVRILCEVGVPRPGNPTTTEVVSHDVVVEPLDDAVRVAVHVDGEPLGDLLTGE